MQTPLVFQAVLQLLLDLAIPASLASFVMAGMKLRTEGGMNFEASGGFLRWLFWGALLLTIPGTSSWLIQEQVPGAQQLVFAGVPTPYTSKIEAVTNDFVSDILVGHIVPVIAAALIFKAILDHADGNSPLASVISALFLLGVQGIYNLATGRWLQPGVYSTTDFLMSAFNYAAMTIGPIVGGLAISAGILSYVRHRAWVHYVSSGLGFLCVAGIWTLVKSWAEVTL